MTTVRFQENGPEHSVPGFDMTPQAREALLKPQPMYSRDVLHDTLVVLNDDLPEHQRAYLTRAREMLGSVASVRLASQIYDEAGMEVAQIVRARQGTGPRLLSRVLSLCAGAFD
ncbi:hypothetical protein C2U69_32020 [Cupriavidus pinatubonensis]|nr:hypothetical protein C2U69_32020 [Cupriavidus pinatubonensis]